MPENADLQGEAAWRLLAEFSLPIDLDTPDRVVARVADTVAELHLPEARLRQVREMVNAALANHADQRTIIIRLFIALSDGLLRDSGLVSRGWGLFSVQKVLEPDTASATPLLILEIFFYT